MGLWIWFLVGIALGALLVLSLKRFVERLAPQDDEITAPTVVVGFFGRHLLLGLALYVAIRQDALAGVLLVAGIWVGRWGMILVGLKSS